MNGRHVALVVEDDEATAEDLVAVLESLECDCVVVDNKTDALAAVHGRLFCFVLVDLQIKGDSDSIRGSTAFGQSLIREIRRIHSDFTGLAHWLPIIVVSGFAREVSAAVEVMKDGASDVVQKPLNTSSVSEAIRRALERSGRLTHESCAETPRSVPPNDSPTVTLAIPADRRRRRTRITIERKPIMLVDADLKTLLRLVVGRLMSKPVHKRELGARDEQGFRGISNLRAALRPALPDGVDIIGNDYNGYYFLTDKVSIGDCDIQKLTQFGDSTITEIAQELGRSLAAPR